MTDYSYGGRKDNNIFNQRTTMNVINSITNKYGTSLDAKNLNDIRNICNALYKKGTLDLGKINVQKNQFGNKPTLEERSQINNATKARMNLDLPKNTSGNAELKITITDKNGKKVTLFFVEKVNSDPEAENGTGIVVTTKTSPNQSTYNPANAIPGTDLDIEYVTKNNIPKGYDAAYNNNINSLSVLSSNIQNLNNNISGFAIKPFDFGVVDESSLSSLENCKDTKGLLSFLRTSSIISKDGVFTKDALSKAKSTSNTKLDKFGITEKELSSFIKQGHKNFYNSMINKPIIEVEYGTKTKIMNNKGQTLNEGFLELSMYGPDEKASKVRLLIDINKNKIGAALNIGGRAFYDINKGSLINPADWSDFGPTKVSDDETHLSYSSDINNLGKVIEQITTEGALGVTEYNHNIKGHQPIKLNDTPNEIGAREKLISTQLSKNIISSLEGLSLTTDPAGKDITDQVQFGTSYLTNPEGYVVGELFIDYDHSGQNPNSVYCSVVYYTYEDNNPDEKRLNDQYMSGTSGTSITKVDGGGVSDFEPFNMNDVRNTNSYTPARTGSVQPSNVHVVRYTSGNNRYTRNFIEINTTVSRPGIYFNNGLEILRDAVGAYDPPLDPPDAKIKTLATLMGIPFNDGDNINTIATNLTNRLIPPGSNYVLDLANMKPHPENPNIWTIQLGFADSNGSQIMSNHYMYITANYITANPNTGGDFDDALMTANIANPSGLVDPSTVADPSDDISDLSEIDNTLVQAGTFPHIDRDNDLTTNNPYEFRNSTLATANYFDDGAIIIDDQSVPIKIANQLENTVIRPQNNPYSQGQLNDFYSNEYDSREAKDVIKSVSTEAFTRTEANIYNGIATNYFANTASYQPGTSPPFIFAISEKTDDIASLPWTSSSVNSFSVSAGSNLASEIYKNQNGPFDYNVTTPHILGNQYSYNYPENTNFLPTFALDATKTTGKNYLADQQSVATSNSSGYDKLVVFQDMVDLSANYVISGVPNLPRPASIDNSIMSNLKNTKVVSIPLSRLSNIGVIKQNKDNSFDCNTPLFKEMFVLSSDGNSAILNDNFRSLIDDSFVYNDNYNTTASDYGKPHIVEKSEYTLSNIALRTDQKGHQSKVLYPELYKLQQNDPIKLKALANVLADENSRTMNSQNYVKFLGTKHITMSPSRRALKFQICIPGKDDIRIQLLCATDYKTNILSDQYEMSDILEVMAYKFTGDRNRFEPISIDELYQAMAGSSADFGQYSNDLMIAFFGLYLVEQNPVSEPSLNKPSSNITKAEKEMTLRTQGFDPQNTFTDNLGKDIDNIDTNKPINLVDLTIMTEKTVSHIETEELEPRDISSALKRQNEYYKEMFLAVMNADPKASMEEKIGIASNTIHKYTVNTIGTAGSVAPTLTGALNEENSKGKADLDCIDHASILWTFAQIMANNDKLSDEEKAQWGKVNFISYIDHVAISYEASGKNMIYDIYDNDASGVDLSTMSSSISKNHASVITSDPKEITSLALQTTANVYTNNGDLEKAYALNEKAISLWPNNTAALYNNANILLAQGKNDEALALINKGLEASKQSINIPGSKLNGKTLLSRDFLFLKAKYHAKKGESTEADKIFTTIIKQNNALIKEGNEYKITALKSNALIYLQDNYSGKSSSKGVKILSELKKVLPNIDVFKSIINDLKTEVNSKHQDQLTELINQKTDNSKA